jgi:2-polyprenyl-3-methyl-5-hydroxy-6-metoxy-1,4-benzoquinol methylase
VNERGYTAARSALNGSCSQPMARPNVHIRPDKDYTYYHQVMAALVLEHTPKAGRVLDLGCGMGHLLSLVHELEGSYQLVGADAFPDCVRRTQERVPSARTVQVPEDRIDFSQLGGDYDTCIMAHSLEHMLRPADVVREVLDHVKPGGHLVLAVPNPVRPTVFFSNVKQKHYVNKGHVYAWDRSHWMNFLERILGLEVVTYASDEVRLFSERVLRVAPVLKRLEIGLSRFVPWWSFSNIAVVRKAGE